MIRLAVVGNSHVGAIKLGWDAAARPGLSTVFFAAPGVQFRRLRMLAPPKLGLPADAPADQRARLEQINGRDAIDLSEFDVVLLAGRSGGIAQAAELLAEHDVDGLPGGDWPRAARQRLSAAAWAACCDAIADAHGLEPPEWRGWTRPRLFVLHRTRPSEVALRSSGDPSTRPWRRLAQAPAKLEAGIAGYLDILEARLAETGIGLLRQPAASLAGTGLTREDMTRGSMRVDGSAAHGEEDATHANAAYGRLVWDALAARLAAETAPA